MKKYLLLYKMLIVLLFLVMGCSKEKEIFQSDNISNTQKQSLTGLQDYYWYNGKQIPLIKTPSKKFILFDVSNEAIVNNTLSQNGLKVNHKPKDYNLSKAIKGYDEKMEKSLKWSIIENSDKKLTEDPSILYEAPFFKTYEGEELGLSNLFYVKLKKSEDVAKLKELSSANNVDVLGNNLYMPLWYTLSCSKKSTGNALEMANKFYETGTFASSQPDMMTPIKNACANDARFNLQWNLNNTGQHNGTAGIDIGYCNARSITQGSNNTIIAIIDEGVELNHPDLNTSTNLSYDAMTGTTPNIVRGSHGNAVAGIMSAFSNNNLGVSGIASASPLMTISVEYGTVTLDSRQKYANAFNYAWTNGASVINNSWTSGSYLNTILDDAISSAINNGRGGLGCVVVFASGNSNSSTVSYPANSNPNILAVGAISYCAERKNPSSCDGESLWGSNYGTELDVVAPGVRIPTTDLLGSAGYDPTDYYNLFNGTSAAAPHVAATAALILSVNPNLTQQQVATIIEQTSRKIGGYSYTTQSGRPNGTWNNEMGYGLINAFAAVTAASCTTVYFNNQTVTNTTNIAGCSVIAQNVTVNSGASLTLAGSQYVLVNSPFIVNSGAQFTMSSP